MASLGNCLGYLWVSLVFGLSVSVIGCFYIPLFNDGDETVKGKVPRRLDERTLHILSTILTLPSTVLVIIVCWMISKAEAQHDVTRRSFASYILIGVVIFALGTAANVVMQVMGDVQVLMKSAEILTINCTNSDNRGESIEECNCVSYWQIIQHVTKLLFVISETIFLSLCVTKHLVPKWWLQLMMANLLAIDIYLAIWTWVYKFTSEHSHNEGEPHLYPDFPGVPESLQYVCKNLSITLTLYKIRSKSIPWLYPLQTEFFLCAAGLLLNFWFHIPNSQKPQGQTGEMHSLSTSDVNIGQARRRVRAQGRGLCNGTIISSLLGACTGLFFFVMVLILGIIDLQDCNNENKHTGSADHNDTYSISTKVAMEWHSYQWIGFRIITITITTVVLLDLFCFHKRRQDVHSTVDMWVLGVFLPAVIVFQLSQLIAAAYLQPSDCSPRIHGQLVITTSVMAVLDGLLQTGLVLCGPHFSCDLKSRSHQSEDVERTPLVQHEGHCCLAKHLLTFLAFCDLSVWLVRSLEAINKQLRSRSAPSQYFGPNIWPNIASFIYPILALFYFHCFACLLELHLLLKPKPKRS
ncbi:uncharacterized protein LOC134188969 [Corticium candelabrum]|uniref:uncharacterized protein LOC134188969 n=1 Tax=Corticium candelabrum TaxID=121492 RepID=UPI002E2556DB|nr:uncharacterized protein LOC134188969 [Corticium candelabrum]